MRIAALLLLVGCGAQGTSFSNGNKDQELPTGTGRMEIDKAEIVISGIQVGYSKSAPFTITSVGDGNLIVYEIRVVTDVDDVFWFDEDGFEEATFAPEQGETYSLVADLDADAPSEGELRIRTNDPDNANLIVPLHAWPEGYEPGSDTGGDTGGEDTGSEDTGEEAEAR